MIRTLLIGLLALVLASCGGGGGKFRSYDGPTVTEIQVHKADRKMYLLHGRKVLEEYDIHLGFTPTGHKQFEGDGKTPEGTYFISQRNPRSSYHLSLRVSYPNNADRAFAKAQGKQPGGDIMIHGGPPRRVSRYDWTAGCIAVTDDEIEEIYSMVRPGTPIHIFP